MINTFARITLALAALAGLVTSCGRDETPRRALTIAFTNDMLGEIRSCGCTDNDNGGLGRRATFVSHARDTTGDFLLFEGGDFFGTEINYGKEKADLTLRSMALIGYDGVAIGEADLGFGLDFIRERARALKVPVVVSNLRDARADTLIFPATREVTLASGLRVGIVGAMGQHVPLPPQVPMGTVSVVDPVEAVGPLVAGLRERVDLVVLLAHMPQGEMERVAKGLEGVDIIVYGHEGRSDRRLRPINGAYLLQTVADRGRYIGVASAVLGADNRIEALTSGFTLLTNRFEDDEAIAKLFKTYDLSIVAKEGSPLPAGVYEASEGIKKPFVGAEECEACHAEAYEQWAGTKHAHAFDILVERSREFDRDCTPCHTTGFYKYGGFVNVKTTPELTNVQCEQCHGNGNDHAANPEVAATTGSPRSACQACHNADQTPDFDFDTFWERIRH